MYCRDLVDPNFYVDMKVVSLNKKNCHHLFTYDTAIQAATVQGLPREYNGTNSG